MRNIQSDLEIISGKNSILEQDFENEINKKNLNAKEIGQIINSINNIYYLCQVQQEKKGKHMDPQDTRVKEGDHLLVDSL